MKRKAYGTFLILTASLLIISLAASCIVFASAYIHTIENEEVAVSESSSRAAVRTEMKVCVPSMKYYKNSALSGNPLDSKKFGEIVFAQKISDGVMCIFNKNGAMLGYCRDSDLVKTSAKYFAEIPYEWNEDGKVSQLVDLRKYILIFGADVTCDDSDPVLVQYETAVKLFGAAKEISEMYGYKLCVDSAYVPESLLPDESCCTLCSHSTGAVLTFSLSPLEQGESADDEGIVAQENEGTNEGETKPPVPPTLSEVVSILARYSLLRDGESYCFYDADFESYISTDHDMSSLTYSIWE